MVAFWGSRRVYMAILFIIKSQWFASRRAGGRESYVKNLLTSGEIRTIVAYGKRFLKQRTCFQSVNVQEIQGEQ